MGTSFSKNRFEYLEKNRHNHQAILALFDEYDIDVSGKLEGPELANFVEELTQYLYQSKFQPKNIKITLSDIRTLIYNTVEQNHDGKFDRSEICNNVDKIFTVVDKYISLHSFST